MVFKNLCVFVIWMKVASALEALNVYNIIIRFFNSLGAEGSWSKWCGCTKTCGGGKRLRRFVNDTQVEDCNSTPCKFYCLRTLHVI